MLRFLLASATLLLSAASAPAFTYLGEFGKPGFEEIGAFELLSYIAVDPAGHVWIANSAGTSRLQEFSATGAHLHTWWTRGDIKTQLNTPGPLAFTPDGAHLFVVTYPSVIWKGTLTGVNTHTFGGTGYADDKFYKASGIAVDSLGFVYVTDRDRGTISKFSSTGAFQTSWRFSSVKNSRINAAFSSITVQTVTNPNHTKTDFLYVTEGQDSSVLKLDTTGRVLQRFGGTRGPGNGQLDDPQSVVVDKNGLVYVADYYNQRVEVFEPNGAFAFAYKGTADSKTQTFLVNGLALSPTGNVLYVLIDHISKVLRYQIY